MTHAPKFLSATSITNDQVKNPEGNDLGKIEDLMIDLEAGRIAYAVLSFGGILGIGNKLFAVPWSALTLDADQECFILPVAQELLEKAPGFDPEDWPEHRPDHKWMATIYKYYGRERYW